LNSRVNISEKILGQFINPLPTNARLSEQNSTSIQPVLWLGTFSLNLRILFFLLFIFTLNSIVLLNNSLNAQSFRPSLTVIGSRYAGKTYSGSRMHHPGAEFTLYTGKKRVETLIRFSLGRVSGEDSWRQFQSPEKNLFITDFRAVGIGINYLFLKEKKISPQLRLSTQVLNFLPRDIDQKALPVQSNLSTGIQYGLGLRYKLNPSLSLQLNWEYCWVFSSEFTGAITNENSGYNLLGLGLIMGKKSE
jgi:hypothetical protein